MVPTFGGVLAAGAVRVDRLSLCVVIAIAAPTLGNRSVRSFRIAKSNSLPAGPRAARASRHLDTEDDSPVTSKTDSM